MAVWLLGAYVEIKRHTGRIGFSRRFICGRVGDDTDAYSGLAVLV